MQFRLNRLLLLVAWCSVLFTALSSSLATAQTLDSLPQAVQDEIATLCLPVQYREGAAAYRNCIQTEIALRNPQANRPAGTNQLLGLTFDDKYAVQQACASAGAQSSEAYQQCTIEQIAELRKHPAPVLQGISEDEQYAIQQSCFDAQSKIGAGAYRQCINEQIASLQQIPAVDTDGLNMLDKNALQLRCSANTRNAADYRRCIAAEYASIVGTDPVFKSALPAPVETTLPTDSADTASAEAGQVSVPGTPTVPTVTAGNTVPESTAVVETLPAESTPLAATTDSPVDARADTQDAPATALADTSLAETATATAEGTSLALSPRNIEPQRAATTTDPTTITDAQQTNTVALDSTANTAANNNSRVISKPALVSALEARQHSQDDQNTSHVSRNQTDNAEAGSNGENPAIGRAEGEPGTMLDNLLATAKSALGSLGGMHWTIIAAVCAVPLLLFSLLSVVRSVRRREPVQDLAATAASLQEMDRRQQGMYASDDTRDPLQDDTQGDIRDDLADTLEFEERGALANSTNRSSFHAWLNSEPAELRQQHCIEFLIYWMAYGDNRFDPALRETLLSVPAGDLHDHDLIKRTVLEQDTAAFTGVIKWIRDNSTREQLEQTIQLLGTLLVSEHAVSPVQNTLLRFLSDVFGLGREHLEHSFSENFGHELPPMPRVDLLAWWQKQSFTAVQRWDSQAMAKRPENEQMMARLGLSDDYDEQAVIAAFRRASRRCHTDRYNALGPRERALAEKQFGKFEQARDILLGVSV